MSLLAESGLQKQATPLGGGAGVIGVNPARFWEPISITLNRKFYPSLVSPQLCSLKADNGEPPPPLPNFLASVFVKAPLLTRQRRSGIYIVFFFFPKNKKKFITLPTKHVCGNDTASEQVGYGDIVVTNDAGGDGAHDPLGVLLAPVPGHAGE